MRSARNLVATQNGAGVVSGTAKKRSIGFGAVGRAVEHDALAIEVDKGSQSEIPVLPHIADGGGGLVDTLHERPRRQILKAL